MNMDEILKFFSDTSIGKILVNAISGIVTLLSTHYIGKFLNKGKEPDMALEAFRANNNILQDLDFSTKLSHAACAKKITVWARQPIMGPIFEELVEKYPQVPIPSEYWNGHVIDWETLANPQNKNFQIKTTSLLGHSTSNFFCDLYVNRQEINKWLKTQKLKEFAK